MIPTPLVAPPARARSTSRPVWWAGSWVGVLLLVVAVFGAVLWVGAVSPLGFRRFSVFDADRRIDFRQPGTFVVFEEYRGASRPSFPPALDVTVRGDAPVTVDKLIQPGQSAAPDAYRDAFGHEGRAIARFTITEPGSYRVRVNPKPLGTYDPAEYASRTRGTIALGRDLATTWLATPWGVVALVVVPLITGLVLLVLTRRARRRARRAAASATGPADAVALLDARRSGREPVAASGRTAR
ncbi:MAG: hypothetical protein R2726_01870 [Acidimicrobiales bacterium]